MQIYIEELDVIIDQTPAGDHRQTLIRERLLIANERRYMRQIRERQKK